MNFSRLVQTCRRSGISSFQERTLLFIAILAAFHAVSCAGASVATQAPQVNPQSKIVLVPNTVDFSNVVLGQKNSQTIKLSNTDSNAVQIKNILIVGAGFTIAGLKFPFSIDPGNSRTFNVEFAPTSAGPVKGTLTIESNLPDLVTLTVKGTGAKALPKLQTSPASIDFGSLIVKGTAKQTVVISNPGNANITVSKVVLSGTAFALSQHPSKFELRPLQETSLVVTFHPQIKGSAKGSLQIFGNDLSAPLTVSLAGIGSDTSPTPSPSGHTVTLTWNASPGNIKGYHVYRGEISGGPYTRLTATPVASLDYSDSRVASGRGYFYVVTAVNHNGQESGYSQEISITIPNP
jgi:hypothetical protein